MYTTSLRKVGGSVMLAVPPAVLELLNLRAGTRIGISVNDGRLLLEPAPRPRYSLGELLAQCDASMESASDERAWLDAAPVGHELLS